MIRNPFGKLNVEQVASDDEKIKNDDKIEDVHQVEDIKKKIKPVNEKILEDEQGFDVPKKGRKSPEESLVMPSHKVPYMYKDDVVHTKKGRMFDKHSGTGRGKEVAKGGAGGHYTWGDNLKTISLEVTKHLNDPSIEGENEEESKDY
jgi:hypothetical protein